MAIGELGAVCRRCETFNEPGVAACVTCGFDLAAEDHEGVLDTEEVAENVPEADVIEESGLEMTREEAAEAGGEFWDAKTDPGVDVEVVSAAPLPAAPPTNLPSVQHGFQASLFVEQGPEQGTAFLLGEAKSTLGGPGATVELSDPHVAPRAASLTFEGDHLILRDEGSVNGVYLRVRAPAALDLGDRFIVGNRLFRYDGPAPIPHTDEATFLGSPRPAGPPVRITELLAGGGSGRVCYRSGPVLSIGRAGCDLSFPADEELQPRQVELRILAGGVAQLIDLAAAPGAVYVRVRPGAEVPLDTEDAMRLGDQVLRVDRG